MSFELLRKLRKNLYGITFWNISFRYIRPENYPVGDSKDYPLLAGQNVQPNKAFESSEFN